MLVTLVLSMILMAALFLLIFVALVKDRRRFCMVHGTGCGMVLPFGSSYAEATVKGGRI